MSSLQAPRGCPDIFPDDFAKREAIIQVFRKQAELYGFQEHQTPIFEHSDVFLKTLGDDTDVVTKEMYELKEKGDEAFVLRPEATASVARLFISHKLFRELPYKVFYCGPMFRHERPQKGRLRQFYQLGIECIGAKDPYVDAEAIAMSWQCLKKLGLDKKSKILLNSLGNPEERKDFKAELVKYFTQKKSELSEDSQRRLTSNPLRILDSKDEQDQKLIQEAPLLKDFLKEDSRTYIQEVQDYLESLDIPVNYSNQLVRGLDYYTGTVFEIQNSQLGAQATLLAGGRYDQLIQSMGGPDCPSFGWAAGLERLSLLFTHKPLEANLVGVIDMTQSHRKELLEVTEALRAKGQSVYYSLSGNFSKQLKKCEKKGCQEVVIFGPDEIANQTLQVKYLKSGEQKVFNKKDYLGT